MSTRKPPTIFVQFVLALIGIAMCSAGAGLVAAVVGVTFELALGLVASAGLGVFAISFVTVHVGLQKRVEELERRGAVR